MKELCELWDVLSLALGLVTWEDTYVKLTAFLLKKCTLYNCHTSVKQKQKQVLPWRALSTRLGSWAFSKVGMATSLPCYVDNKRHRMNHTARVPGFQGEGVAGLRSGCCSPLWPRQPARGPGRNALPAHPSSRPSLAPTSSAGCPLT